MSLRARLDCDLQASKLQARDLQAPELQARQLQVLLKRMAMQFAEKAAAA